MPRSQSSGLELASNVLYRTRIRSNLNSLQNLGQVSNEAHRVFGFLLACQVSPGPHWLKLASVPLHPKTIVYFSSAKAPSVTCACITVDLELIVSSCYSSSLCWLLAAKLPLRPTGPQVAGAAGVCTPGRPSEDRQPRCSSACHPDPGTFTSSGHVVGHHERYSRRGG